MSWSLLSHVLCADVWLVCWMAVQVHEVKPWWDVQGLPPYSVPPVAMHYAGVCEISGILCQRSRKRDETVACVWDLRLSSAPDAGISWIRLNIPPISSRKCANQSFPSGVLNLQQLQPEVFKLCSSRLESKTPGVSCVSNCWCVQATLCSSGSRLLGQVLWNRAQLVAVFLPSA